MTLNLQGRRFGNLSVIGRARGGTSGVVMWSCKCDCGRTLTTSRAYLTHGKKTACSRSCTSGYHGDMRGKKFGRLTVVARAPTPRRASAWGRYWRCRCDCGNMVTKPTRNLSVGVSCGCVQKLPGDLTARNVVISGYRQTAERRGFAFALTIAQCDRLFRSDCHYCGREPSQRRRVNKSVFVYNGIDRKNSKLGYTIRNVVPCCKLCNQRKSITPYKEFVAWLIACAAIAGKHVSKRGNRKIVLLAHRTSVIGGRAFRPAA